MRISVSGAEAQLTDLVRHAEAGDDVILTRRGAPTVRLVRVEPDDVRGQRRQAIDRFIGCIEGHPRFDGTDAAHCADYLYDDKGAPV